MKFLLFSVILSIVLGVQFLTAKKIECYTQFGLCDERLYALSQQLKYIRLLWPLPHKTAAALFSSPHIKQISLRRRLPDTLIVTLKLTRPIGVVSSMLGGSATIDDSGNVLETTPASGLPVLFITEKIQTGAPLDGHVVDSLRILAQIRTLVSAPISARLEKNTLAAQISPATQVLINLDKPAQNWYTALQVIWERSRIEGKKPQIIDLRFKSPVLTY